MVEPKPSYKCDPFHQINGERTSKYLVLLRAQQVHKHVSKSRKGKTTCVPHKFQLQNKSVPQKPPKIQAQTHILSKINNKSRPALHRIQCKHTYLITIDSNLIFEKPNVQQIRVTY